MWIIDSGKIFEVRSTADGWECETGIVFAQGSKKVFTSKRGAQIDLLEKVLEVQQAIIQKEIALLSETMRQIEGLKYV